MSDDRLSSFTRFFTRPRLAAFGFLLTLVSTLATGIWVVVTYVRYDIHQRETESRTRLLEAQKPFLTKQLDVFFATAEVAGKLASIDPKRPMPRAEWQELSTHFWALRWSKMELIGNPDLRDRMRRVGDAINKVDDAWETHTLDEDKAHQVRWMVECLADEMRLALEGAWQNEPAYVKSELPQGCYAVGPPRPALPVRPPGSR